MISEERSWILWGEVDYNVEAFARAVEAEARREALEAVEAVGTRYHLQHDASSENVADECASAIRALVEKPTPSPPARRA